jgi:hypothetical protein
MRIDGPQITGSFNLNGDTVADLDVLVTTSSLNTYTSSVNTTMGHVMTATHSLNTFTSSVTTRLNIIEGVTGSYATTGSNIFVGNQTISGSIIPSVTNAYDLGSSTHQFRHIYISSGSLYIDGTKVLGSTSQELQITTDAGQSFKILEAGSDTITLQSADGNITLATSGGGDVIMDPTTGIIALKGTTQIYAGNKVRSSDGNNIVFGDGLTVSGSITVTGFIETQELRTTFISSSILYRSGSTKFGDELGDTHAFTGSLLVSGSISVPGSGLVSGSSQVSYTGLSNVPSGIVSGSSQVLNASGVWSGSAQLPSGVVSGSAQLPSGLISGSAQLPSGTVSGSAQISFTGTTGYSTYINQALLTTSNPTFNSVISGDIRYNGTGYITYDVANSGTNSLVVRKFGTTVLTLNSSGYLGVNVDPSFYLDVQSNVANSFYTIAQFENRDYTSGTRSFIRVRNWVNAGGSYSSYFGQGQDGKTYIIANNSARGGDIVIDSGNGFVGINQSSPTQRLHLYDASPSNGILAKLQSGAVTGWLQLTSTGTSWQIGATATGLQFWSDNETSTKLTVLTGGSILMNQDVAIRAGASQNWILGQDSGTNVIHMGSTGVANDIRFDSSTGSGIVMIKSNGNLGVGFTTVTNKLQVAGEITTHAGTNTQFYAYMNYLGTTYNLGPGETSDNIDFKIVGGATFATGGNFRWFTQAGGTTPTERFRLTPTGPAYFTNKLTVGGTGNYSSATLSVEGPVRSNRSIYNWYQSGTNSWDGYQYLHLKTTLWGGGGGNNSQPTMSMFSAKLYSYSSAYIREGNLAFHNWSGSIYNQVTTGTIWYGAYVSSDGYVTLILALGGGSYHGVHIDWHQSFGYGFQDRYVSATAYTNTASSLY